MCVAFERISEDTCWRILPSLRLLTTLHLRLHDISRNLYRHLSRHGRLRQILTDLPSLEDLQICLQPILESEIVDAPRSGYPIVPLQDILGDVVFEKLKHLVLGDFWLETGELCEFLLRHRQSLADLTLHSIRLGETMDAQRLVEGVGLSDLPRTCTHYPTTMAVPKQWDQVAKTCQQMPKLTGLTIIAAAEGIEWSELGLVGSFRVTDLGMNGRPNSHLQAQAERRKCGKDWLAKHAQPEP